MRLLSSMGRRTRERTAVSCEGARARSHGAKIVQCSSRLETTAKLGSIATTLHSPTSVDEAVRMRGRCKRACPV